MKGKINIPIPEFKSFMKDVIKVAANEAKNFTIDNWKLKGSYVENTSSFKPWSPRKREYYSYENGRKVRFSKGKDVLVNTGDLRLSIKETVLSRTRALVYSALPYSAKHNEGLDGMTKRQFLNDNKKLGEKLEKSVTLLMKNKGH